jgi:hypothetical protein
VKGGATADGGQHALDALVVGDQQIAGGGAHEHLDPAAAGQPLQFAQLVGVLMRAADIEGVVAVHAAPGARQLVGQRLGRDRVGIGVRHLKHGRDAAEHRAARAGLQVFLPLHAGLAEMHLGVDDAGQDGQAARVEHLAGRGLAEVADVGDQPVAHPHVRQPAPGMVRHLAATDDHVEGVSHARFRFRGWARLL